MTASEYLSSQPIVTRRLFALLLLLVIVVGAWQGFVVPAGQLIRSQDSWRTAATEKLGYSRGVVASEAQARNQLQAVRTTSAWRGFLTNSDLASNELKNELTQALTGAGATGVRIASLPAQNEGGLRKFGARIVATADADQLKQFLAALRARPRYLRVEQITVTAPLVQSPDGNPAVQLKADIFGYTKGTQ